MQVDQKPSPWPCVVMLVGLLVCCLARAALLATECRARPPAGYRLNQREAGTNHNGTG